MLSPEIVNPPATPTNSPNPDTPHLKTRVDALEIELVNQGAEQAGGNLAKAARTLGMSRNGLVMKMERLGLGNSGPE